MKGALKVIIPIIMIAAGVAMCSVAYAMGETSPSIWIGDRDYSETFGVKESFESIVCDVDVMDINIVCGEVPQGYTALVDAEDVNEEFFDCRVENNVLKISHVKEEKLFGNINFGFDFDAPSEIDIIVPADSKLSTTSVSLGVGEITFANFNVCDVIAVDSGVGEIQLVNSAAAKGDFDYGIGDFKATNTTFTELVIDSGIGDIKFIGQLLGDVEIDHGIGDVKMELSGDYSSHDFDLEGGIGDKKMTGIVSGTSEVYDFNVDNGIGDIKLFAAGLGNFDVKISDIDIDSSKVTVDLGIIKVETDNDDVKVDIGDIKVDTGVEKIEVNI